MSSKLLRPGSEMFRKKTGEKNLGKESLHPQYPAGFGGREGKQGAPKTRWAPAAVASDHTGGGFKEHRVGDWGGNHSARSGGKNVDGVKAGRAGWKAKVGVAPGAPR